MSRSGARDRSLLFIVGGAVLLLALARALHRDADPARSARVGDPLVRRAIASEPSNILPRDYVGPEKCAGCHDEKYRSWRAHPHSRMNANATDATVRGDFSGVRVPYEDGEVVFDRRDGKDAMTLERRKKLVRSYVVTRTVGSRFMQFYIGKQVAGPEPASSLVYSQEQKLPFGYWFKIKRWLPVSYFDPVGAETKPDGTPAFDPFDRPRVHLYASNCMLCHNTYPYLYRLELPDGLCGIPQGDYALAMDPLLEETKKNVDLSPRKDGLAQTVRDRLDPDRNLVTLGISCESCHFGGREHALDEGEASWVPQSPYLKLDPKSAKRRAKDARASKDDPYTVNNICAQCHRASITLYPNGCGTWNSREALDMAGGACQGAIKCTDCHDPHVTIGREAQEDNAKHLAACVRCHEKLREPAAQLAHSGHDAKNASCLDCHMPRVTQGLEEVVRTHRISSPTDAKMLAAGSWNSCNLCHLDKPIAWTLAELEKRWKKRIEPTPEWTARYGEKLELAVGRAWIEGKDASMRLVAGQAWSRSPLGKPALPLLRAELDDVVAVNRVFATFAIERVTGKLPAPPDYDVTAPRAVRQKQIAAMGR